MHENLTDNLFGAPGKWHLKRCTNPRCGLVWLDPMPRPDEIWKAYSTYYTHADSVGTPGWRKRVVSQAKQEYWAIHFGYRRPVTSLLERLVCTLFYLSPIHRRETEAEVRWLPAVQNGRLLDVGCGAGGWIHAMQSRGWSVDGVDFDPKAVAVARSKGLQVRLGALEDQDYPNETFDAITLSHVIEHVPYPNNTLAECYRLLKPGGKIVLLTPNSGSLSHKIFKKSWRGLEPPRHLHIFSLPSMEALLKNNGFEENWVRPFIVSSVIYDSLQIKWGRGRFAAGSFIHWIAWTIVRLFKMVELVVLPLAPSLGDCIVAVAVKQK